MKADGSTGGEGRGAHEHRPGNELVEHKASTSELREGVASIASILNKHGRGVLYFGVKNNGDVVGQQVADSTLREISQAIAHSIEPAVYPTVERLETDDGRAYVRVSFEGHDAPYACKNVYRIRVSDEDRPMDPDKLESMMLERAYRKKPWDRHPSARPLSDVDEKAVRKFVERGRAHGRIAFEHESIETTLEHLHLIEGGRMLNAAEVLFCPSETVQLKMGIFVSHARTEALDMHHEAGTLFDLVDAAELYILNNIRRRFVVTGESSASNTRNELIASTLYRSGDIESSGMGIKKIKDLCDEAGVEVAYERVSFGTKVVFARKDPFVPIPEHTEPESSGKVREKFGLELSKSESAVVALMQERGAIATPEVMELLSITDRGAQRLLGRLIEKEVAEKVGAGRNTRYKLRF